MDLTPPMLPQAAEAPASAMPQPSAWQSVMSNKISIALAIAGVSAHGVLLYSGFVWTNTYVVKRGMSPAGAMAASLCGRMLTIIFAIPTGWLIDRHELGACRGWVRLGYAIARPMYGTAMSLVGRVMWRRSFGCWARGGGRS